ncbi:MAG: VWA domain-containing protein [Pirellulaceae bacterium]|nr:VWA domain-containing protein [Pirellulaceae bacterium]
MTVRSENDVDSKSLADSDEGEQDTEEASSDAETTRSEHWIEMGRDFWRQSSSVLTSIIVHAVVLLILALLTVTSYVREELEIVVAHTEVQTIEEMEEIEQIVSDPEEFTTPTTSESSATPSEMAGDVGATGAVSLQQAIVEDLAAVTEAETSFTPSIESPVALPGMNELAGRLDSGIKGEGRAVVDSYSQAFDRLTQELLMMLEDSRVLVVWCFDQSGSMKDDQQEIREKIEKVYQELGLIEIAGDDNLVTGVTSYGKELRVHLGRPTSKLEDIQKAIDEVPVDPSGEEKMTLAIAYSIEQYREFAKRTRRKMALILVSDESGNRDDNDAHLEQTIALAKEARSRIYVLGREAVFGYPYAHIRWEHPQTFVVHWIPVDRGPESAVVEQLQTEGFRRRYDSHPSGFGPYEQSRMAWETNGIFFMLPSIESDVVDFDSRRYRLDKMKPYQPDLRIRTTILDEVNASVLRSGLMQIIYDMNPYNEESSKIIDMRYEFSIDFGTFVEQVRTEQAKSLIYMEYLDRMRVALEKVWELRNQEVSPRWRGNADLMRGQLLAYKIRLYEYGAYLEEFLNNPKEAAPTQEPNLHLIHWSLSRRQEMLTGEVTAKFVEQAKQYFADVIDKHPGTPWAARAEKEMSSGFGVELTPYYRRVPTSGGGNSPLIPVPKL